MFRFARVSSLLPLLFLAWAQPTFAAVTPTEPRCEYLDNPQGIDATLWEQVRPFVVGCLNRLDADDGPGARRAARALVRLVAWAAVQGVVNNSVTVQIGTANQFFRLRKP